jgi:hypothetical protein
MLRLLNVGRRAGPDFAKRMQKRHHPVMANWNGKPPLDLQSRHGVTFGRFAERIFSNMLICRASFSESSFTSGTAV